MTLANAIAQIMANRPTWADIIQGVAARGIVADDHDISRAVSAHCASDGHHMGPDGRYRPDPNGTRARAAEARVLGVLTRQGMRYDEIVAATGLSRQIATNAIRRLRTRDAVVCDHVVIEGYRYVTVRLPDAPEVAA